MAVARRGPATGPRRAEVEAFVASLAEAEMT
jgi:hypothetical protein